MLKIFELLNFRKKSNIPSNGITLTIKLVFDVKNFWRFTALRMDTKMEQCNLTWQFLCQSSQTCKKRLKTLTIG